MTVKATQGDGSAARTGAENLYVDVDMSPEAEHGVQAPQPLRIYFRIAHKQPSAQKMPESSSIRLTQDEMAIQVMCVSAGPAAGVDIGRMSRQRLAVLSYTDSEPDFLKENLWVHELQAQLLYTLPSWTSSDAQERAPISALLERIYSGGALVGNYKPAALSAQDPLRPVAESLVGRGILEHVGNYGLTRGSVPNHKTLPV